jgi:hypothetical protein
MQALAAGSSNVGHLVVESRSTAAAVIEKESFGKNETGKESGNRHIHETLLWTLLWTYSKKVDTFCDWRI